MSHPSLESMKRKHSPLSSSPLEEAPCTPTRESEPQATLFAGCEGQTVLHAILQAWRDTLVLLQPAVNMPDEALSGALALLQEVVTVRPDLAWALSASAPTLASFSAATLWLSAKLCAVRTEIPNRTLMSQATGVHCEALSAAELDVCKALRWDVAAVLRSRGLL